MATGSINKQLGIGIAPSKLFPTRYTRGLQTANPQLYTEDWALDYYNDIGFDNANGNVNVTLHNDDWSYSYGRESCRAKCTQYFPSDEEKYLKKACDKTCKTECTNAKRCPPKGKNPYPTKDSILERAGLLPVVEEIEAAEQPESVARPSGGVNKGVVIVGAVVALAIVGLFVIKRKK